MHQKPKNRTKNGRKPRTVGMLGTEKPQQNFGKTEKPHKKSPRTAKPQTSDTPPLRVLLQFIEIIHIYNWTSDRVDVDISQSYKGIYSYLFCCV